MGRTFPARSRLRHTWPPRVSASAAAAAFPCPRSPSAAAPAIPGLLRPGLRPPAARAGTAASGSARWGPAAAAAAAADTSATALRRASPAAERAPRRCLGPPAAARHMDPSALGSRHPCLLPRELCCAASHPAHILPGQWNRWGHCRNRRKREHLRQEAGVIEGGRGRRKRTGAAARGGRGEEGHQSSQEETGLEGKGEGGWTRVGRRNKQLEQQQP